MNINMREKEMTETNVQIFLNNIVICDFADRLIITVFKSVGNTN